MNEPLKTMDVAYFRSPMENFLEHLLGPPETTRTPGASGAIPVQIMFRWDASMNGGMLSRTETRGIYSLLTEATTAANSPQGANKPVLVEQMFDASAVARVMVVTAKPEPLIKVPS